MLNLIIQNGTTIIAALLLFSGLTMIALKMRRDKKAGKSGCSSCANCESCKGCAGANSDI